MARRRLTEQRLILIAAVDECGGIGREGRIPWDNPEDRAFFKATTIGHPTIVGRRTFESFGARPLPGRPCAVWTHSPEALLAPSDDLFASASLEALCRWCDAFHREIFVLGGAQLYQAMLPYADLVRLSRIPGDYHCDVFFPAMPGAHCLQRIAHATFVEELLFSQPSLRNDMASPEWGRGPISAQ